MLSDNEIAQRISLKPIQEIAKKLNLTDDDLELYGKYKAKINKPISNSKHGKLILVTAINPTPAGEGKTTTSIGLADSLQKLGKSVCLALREPALGPTFGVKGGATGGGYAQVVPMEDINLHFTGDFHAIENANNLCCAMLDNHIYQGNELNIDINNIIIHRCIDMNDRQLRNVSDGVNVSGKERNPDGVTRMDHFDITVASEVMAVFCLAKDIEDLQRRLGNMIIAYSVDGKPITARDIKADGAMTALLKDAIKPNLVQTLEGTPAIIHGGPFANIAHGCNSIIATRTAMSLADYVVTEAGFGADLGAEKFLDIKCRTNNLKPDCIVLVATVRALKYNGGMDKDMLKVEDVNMLSRGICNLERHINNLKAYNIPLVVAINKFDTDTDAEINFIKDFCKSKNTLCVTSEVHANGSNGGLSLAEAVLLASGTVQLHSIGAFGAEMKFPYELNSSIKEKIEALAIKVYNAKDVSYSNAAEETIERINKMGINYSMLPVCIAKTQYSFSDNAKLLGAPVDYTFHVREIRLSAGAEFIVAICGKISTMPGLPKSPAAERIGVANGKIFGVF